MFLPHTYDKVLRDRNSVSEPFKFTADNRHFFRTTDFKISHNCNKRAVFIWFLAFSRNVISFEKQDSCPSWLPLPNRKELSWNLVTRQCLHTQLYYPSTPSRTWWSLSSCWSWFFSSPSHTMIHFISWYPSSDHDNSLPTSSPLPPHENHPPMYQV